MKLSEFIGLNWTDQSNIIKDIILEDVSDFNQEVESISDPFHQDLYYRDITIKQVLDNAYDTIHSKLIKGVEIKNNSGEVYKFSDTYTCRKLPRYSSNLPYATICFNRELNDIFNANADRYLESIKNDTDNSFKEEFPFSYTFMVGIMTNLFVYSFFRKDLTEENMNYSYAALFPKGEGIHWYTNKDKYTSDLYTKFCDAYMNDEDTFYDIVSARVENVLAPYAKYFNINIITPDVILLKLLIVFSAFTLGTHISFDNFVFSSPLCSLYAVDLVNTKCFLEQKLVTGASLNYVKVDFKDPIQLGIYVSEEYENQSASNKREDEYSFPKQTDAVFGVLTHTWEEQDSSGETKIVLGMLSFWEIAFLAWCITPFINRDLEEKFFKRYRQVFSIDMSMENTRTQDSKISSYPSDCLYGSSTPMLACAMLRERTDVNAKDANSHISSEKSNKQFTPLNSVKVFSRTGVYNSFEVSPKYSISDLINTAICDNATELSFGTNKLAPITQSCTYERTISVDTVLTILVHSLTNTSTFLINKPVSKVMDDGSTVTVPFYGCYDMNGSEKSKHKLSEFLDYCKMISGIVSEFYNCGFTRPKDNSRDLFTPDANWVHAKDVLLDFLCKLLSGYIFNASRVVGLTDLRFLFATNDLNELHEFNMYVEKLQKFCSTLVSYGALRPGQKAIYTLFDSMEEEFEFILQTQKFFKRIQVSISPNSSIYTTVRFEHTPFVPGYKTIDGNLKVFTNSHRVPISLPIFALTDSVNLQMHEDYLAFLGMTEDEFKDFYSYNEDDFTITQKREKDFSIGLNLNPEVVPFILNKDCYWFKNEFTFDLANPNINHERIYPVLSQRRLGYNFENLPIEFINDYTEEKFLTLKSFPRSGRHSKLNLDATPYNFIEKK